MKKKRHNSILYDKIAEHIGHHIVCVSYGDDAQNVAVECEDCCAVIIDADGGL